MEFLLLVPIVAMFVRLWLLYGLAFAFQLYVIIFVLFVFIYYSLNVWNVHIVSNWLM